MRFTYLHLQNYGRIFNGLGLYNLEIDLAKSLNNVILIKGANGRGKTTISDCLSFFPESNSEIINTLPGLKEIHAINGDDVYCAKIVYPITSNGSRGQTKATFEKNGIELNPNGNITSYKEIISNEFNMDPNFISLSFLSSMNRGIADKSPAERKKYINHYLGSLEVYNQINKTLVKRGSVFSSHINSITAKIHNIGDEESLRIQLQSLESRWASLTQQRDNLVQTMTKMEANIEILDPNSEIMDLYNRIFAEISEVDSSIKSLKSEIESLLTGIDNIDEIDIDTVISELTIGITKYSTELTAIQNDIESLRNEKCHINDELSSYESRLLSMQVESNINTIKDNLEKYRKIVSDQEVIFTRFHITDFNINKDDLLLSYNILELVNDKIKSFRSYYDINDITLVCNIYLENVDILADYKNMLSIKEELQEELAGCNYNLVEYKKLKETSDLLKSRPKKCKDDSCFFIQNSLEASKKDPDKLIMDEEVKKEKIESSLENINKNISYGELQYEMYGKLIEIISFINDNISVLKTIPTSLNIVDIKLFVKLLSDGYDFSEISETDNIIQYADVINGYKQNKELLEKLEVDYEKIKSKEEIMSFLNESIKKNKEKISEMDASIELKRKEYDIKMKLYKNTNDRLNQLNSLRDKTHFYEELKSKKNSLKEQYLTIKDNIAKIDSLLKDRIEIQSAIEKLDLEINPLVAERDSVKFSITQLEEYKAELYEYQQKYEVIELLKKYSSPTKGIQVLFMKLYMGKTLNITNDLLSMFFNGEIQLMDYIINESEFRIPCVISGLPRDDISSCSNAQTSMISMILSFVLMSQASDKYNIIRLDEIDGSLDENNRQQFIYLLYQLIDVLGIEQVFIISHSVELDSMKSDLICLSGTDGVYGNVIFDINSYMKNTVV